MSDPWGRDASRTADFALIPPRRDNRGRLVVIVGAGTAVAVIAAAVVWAGLTWSSPATYNSAPAPGNNVQPVAMSAWPTDSASPSASVSTSASASPSPAPSASKQPAGPAPVIPAGPTLCGASFAVPSGQTYVGTLQQEETMIGGLRSVRVFYPGAPSAWPGNAGNVDRTVIVSFKFTPTDVTAGKEDATMRTWFASAPRDRDVYWVYYHEPEDQIAKSVFTAADYRAAWVHLAALARAAGNPRLHATLVLMQWSVNPSSGRNWKDYYAGDSVIDVIGWDVYNLNDNKGTYSTASALVDPVIAASNSVHKPWGVAELGSAKVPSDPSGTARAAWLSSVVTALRQGKALWAAYFDLNWDATHDYRLRDTASETVWRTFCNS